MENLVDVKLFAWQYTKLNLN